MDFCEESKTNVLTYIVFTWNKNDFESKTTDTKKNVYTENMIIYVNFI
jgi:hypothetical protein